MWANINFNSFTTVSAHRLDSLHEYATSRITSTPSAECSIEMGGTLSRVDAVHPRTIVSIIRLSNALSLVVLIDDDDDDDDEEDDDEEDDDDDDDDDAVGGIGVIDNRGGIDVGETDVSHPIDVAFDFVTFDASAARTAQRHSRSIAAFVVASGISLTLRAPHSNDIVTLASRKSASRRSRSRVSVRPAIVFVCL